MQDNILTAVREILLKFEKIDQLHVDFTEDFPSYGLSSTGDRIVKEDILGVWEREHNFVLYCRFASADDLERLLNSGILIELQQYLEKIRNFECSDFFITKITCSNGMMYQVPDTLNDTMVYQLQITANYKGEI